MLGRKKELMEQVRSRDEMIAQLKADLERTNVRLEEYRQREAAVVSALTEAEAAAARKMEAVQAQADELLAAVEAQRQEAEQDALCKRRQAIADAQEYKDNAQREADAIVEKAEAQAQAMLAQAEACLTGYRANADKLNARLLSVAEQAKQELNALQNAMLGLQLSAAQLDETEAFAPAAPSEPVETPENYDTPADLMHSIYAIQGRDIPLPADEAVDEAAGEAPQDTQMGTDAQDPEAAERLWTVDEIITSVLDEDAAKDLGADAELNKLIEDILH